MKRISLLVLRPCGWKMMCSGEPPNSSEERFTRRSPTRGCVLGFKQPHTDKQRLRCKRTPYSKDSRRLKPCIEKTASLDRSCYRCVGARNRWMAWREISRSQGRCSDSRQVPACIEGRRSDRILPPLTACIATRFLMQPRNMLVIRNSPRPSVFVYGQLRARHLLGMPNTRT